MFRFLFDIDTWQELSESLTKNKIRTVITMVGVWWGILLLIALLGFLNYSFSIRSNVSLFPKPYFHLF